VSNGIANKTNFEPGAKKLMERAKNTKAAIGPVGGGPWNSGGLL
jgi:hypothetical protein